jgi:predicted alpha/beta-fold hydrolase
MCRDGAWLNDSDKFVLVGHSFGGLVIKSLFVEASKHNDDKCKKFLKCIKGTIFYSVPHSGDLIAQYIKNFNKAFHQRLAGTLSNLSVFEAEMKKLSKDFEDKIETLSKDLHHAIRGIKIFSFAEQRDYNKVSSRIHL